MGINLETTYATPMVNVLTSSASVLSFCSFVFSALVIFEYIYNFFDKKKQHDSIIVGVMLFLYKRFNLPVQIAKKSQ